MFLDLANETTREAGGAVRAAILTISLILAAVLFGGLIPQGLPPEAYLDRFGESPGRIFLFLGLDDIYRTKGFLLLGVLLFVQLLACTGKRIALLRGNSKLWLAGSVLLHVGLLVFLISTAVSLWWGKSLMIEAPEGKTVALSQKGLPFDIRLERFMIDYYPGSQSVRQYRSEVTLLQGERELQRGSLEVNSPLGYEGTKIFQMSYGWLLEGTIRQLPDGKAQSFSIVNGGWIAGGNGVDRLRGVIMADPDKHPNYKPEVAFLLLSATGDRQAAVVSPGSSAVIGTQEIQLGQIRRYSGLQLKQDPGIAGIFAGLSLSLIGLLLRYAPLGGKTAV